MAKLVRIGYWQAEASDGWPHLASFVDTSWDASERDRVLDHLRRGFIARPYIGFSTCRVCGERNGSLELTDGAYLWPEGLAHYVGAHGVRLPDEFVRHVGQMREAHEDTEVDECWWREVRPDWL